ncbi:hypothetical protein NVP1170O_154 [Vibrio phage 1.170.O._10N.261.52.C3]|nr:hypothetical protein NVP1170O_154 [Vibrio phage 1.170.O._10N.261.52.C3]
MGVDISGGLLVGAPVSEVCYNEDHYDCVHEFADDKGMDLYSPWYDAESDNCTIGYSLPRVDPLSEDFPTWVESVKHKARLFKELTGTDAKIIGMQDVW